MRFIYPFTEADAHRAQTVAPTPRMFAQATFEGVRAALVFRESYLKALIQGVLNETSSEKALIDLHYRMTAYLASLCRLASSRYFQNLATAARSLFELGLDVALLGRDTTQESADRLSAFTRVERYRAAKTLVDFYANHPLPPDLDLTAQRALCSDAQETAAVQQLILQYWGSRRDGTPNQPKHWSKFSDARGRSQQVGGEWEERYVRYYSMLSWHVHAGMVGAENLPQPTFELFSADAYRLAADVTLDAYRILGAKLQLSRAMPEWDQRLVFLSKVASLALMDDRLKSLGEPARLLYLEPDEVEHLRTHYGAI